MTPDIKNVLSVYRRADSQSVSVGFNWYPDALAFANTLDSRYHRAAGVIAALSPMNGWKNNKIKAQLLYAQNGEGTKVGLFRNVAKAQAIYHGEDALDVLGGNKVRSFYLSILEPFGDSVAVDRHAFDIAVGAVTNDSIRRQLDRKGEYARFGDVYREAAQLVGIGPAQLQAVTWVQWRKEQGIDWLD